MISGKIVVTCIGNLHWTMEAVESLGTWLKPLTCRCQSPIGTSREKRLIRKSVTFPVRIWTKDTVTNFECLLSINWEKVSLALWPAMEFLCVTLGVKVCFSNSIRALEYLILFRSSWSSIKACYRGLGSDLLSPVLVPSWFWWGRTNNSLSNWVPRKRAELLAEGWKDKSRGSEGYSPRTNFCDLSRLNRRLCLFIPRESM